MQANQLDTTFPISLSADPVERAEIGERIADLMGHPGWKDFLRGVSAYRDIRAATFPICKEGWPYADFTGEMKGIAKIESIAAGLVKVGEQARAELSRAEGEA